ncbi:hypothetical protein L1987_64201 [Smallanthus sonchifolius]|uniref:Uncharacterized protein n=1 Tax=Smallanthus sonchifolius TaxID=185202 RepID=A0ACB9CFS1_9ASTR|nr:hypothetical protein L1987_64201 [Smallanthus sonchifolius]
MEVQRKNVEKNAGLSYRLFLFFSAIAVLPWFFLPPPVNLRPFVSFTASPSPVDSICLIQSKVIYIIDCSRARVPSLDKIAWFLLSRQSPNQATKVVAIPFFLLTLNARQSKG